jgi:pimeloyl-ACP methyl ester carboxylesterase
MRSIFSPAAGGKAPAQMIWLPGAYHSAQDFIDQGFAQAVARRGIPLDLRFVDLEMQHLDDRDPLARLRSEIVLPARTAGSTVWLGGISLGGMAALDYASMHAGDIDGLCLLAPYLGNRMLIREIAAGAGLAAWDSGELAQAGAEHRIWRYIKTRCGSPPLFLGYGSSDRFAASHELLAAALPPSWVDVVAGGHDWRAWITLWEGFLDSNFI